MFSGNHFPPPTLDDGGGLYLERNCKVPPPFLPGHIELRNYLSGKYKFFFPDKFNEKGKYLSEKGNFNTYMNFIRIIGPK